MAGWSGWALPCWRALGPVCGGGACGVVALVMLAVGWLPACMDGWLVCDMRLKG